MSAQSQLGSEQEEVTELIRLMTNGGLRNVDDESKAAIRTALMHANDLVTQIDTVKGRISGTEAYKTAGEEHRGSQSGRISMGKPSGGDEPDD